MLLATSLDYAVSVRVSSVEIMAPNQFECCIVK